MVHLTDKKKVAITGANGFVGSNLARLLSEDNYTVTSFVRKGADLSLIADKNQVVDFDYQNSCQTTDIIEGHEIVIHIAAVTKARSWQDFYSQNVLLTDQLISIVNRVKSVKQFIFISSQAASGMCNGFRGKREEDECEPLTYYGKSKLFAENLVRQKCRKPWTIIRPSSIYGPGDRDFLQYFKLIKQGVAPVIGLKPKYLCLIYINELACLVEKTIDNEQAFNETFFASDGNTYTWDDLIYSIEQAMGKKAIKVKLPELVLYPVALYNEAISNITNKTPLISFQKIKEIKGTYWICDSKKAQRVLSCEKVNNINQNIEETYKWYIERGWL